MLQSGELMLLDKLHVHSNVPTIVDFLVAEEVQIMLHKHCKSDTPKAFYVLVCHGLSLTK